MKEYKEFLIKAILELDEVGRKVFTESELQKKSIRILERIYDNY